MCVVTERDIFAMRLFLLMSRCAIINVGRRCSELLLVGQSGVRNTGGQNVLSSANQSRTALRATQLPIWWKTVLFFWG